MKTSKIKIATNILLLVTVFTANSALAQDTTFTYQGRLEDGNVPSNNEYAFVVRLFDDAATGVQIGPTFCEDSVEVVNGLFTLTLDFGAQFNSDQRFLDIQVLPEGNCADTSGFIQLTPRQPITATPRAVHALECVEAESAGLSEHAGFCDLATAARRLDAPDGSPTSAVFVDNAGKVGIGTIAPTHVVHIAAAEPTLALQDTNSTSSQVGYVSYRDSGNIERAWVGYGTAGSPHFSIVNARSGGNIELAPIAGGKVTIGPHFATAGDENLRIVRGFINENGVVIAGSGFSAVRNSKGDFTIQFAVPFTAPPIMTCTAEHVPTLVPITAVGEVAQKNLEALGHITVNIDGDSEPKMAGAIHIRCDGPAPEITIGSVLTIEAA